MATWNRRVKVAKSHHDSVTRTTIKMIAFVTDSHTQRVLFLASPANPSTAGDGNEALSMAAFLAVLPNKNSEYSYFQS